MSLEAPAHSQPAIQASQFSLMLGTSVSSGHRGHKRRYGHQQNAALVQLSSEYLVKKSHLPWKYFWLSYFRHGLSCLAKVWCGEMATAMWLAFHHMWMTWVNRPLCLGAFPSSPWGMTQLVGLCCPFCGMFSVLLDCLSLFEKTAAQH